MYTVIILITALVLLVTVSDVITNRLISPKNKREVIAVCVFIFAASFCEYIGKNINGADPELITLHYIVKLIEFCTAPCISITAASAYGKLVYKKTAAVVLAAHALFEVIALINGWVFSIDAQNIYHRERFYIVYVATFVVSIICAYICVLRDNRKYQAKLGITDIVILLFLSFGIGIQMVHSEISVDFMCVAMGNFFLYHYRGNVVNQIDVTTRLLNRRCFERNLENIKSPAYVLVFDINKFKTINDTYGHNEGDKCLGDIGKIIFSVYGKYGRCYRIGGDEFCVIMRKNLDKIKTLNGYFKEAVDECRVLDKKIFGVAVGYAYYDAAESAIDETVKKADEMMYINKMN